jgi:hypothetical protein
MTTQKYDWEDGVDVVVKETTAKKNAHPPGTSIIWHAHSGDYPATITGIMGIDQQTYEVMYTIDCPLQPGNSGIPASKISLTTNEHTTDDELDPDQALDKNFKPPDQAAEDAEDSKRITPRRVGAAIMAMVQVAEGLAASPSRRMLDLLVPLISELPENERDLLELYQVFKTKDAVDAFLSQCSPPPGEPVFESFSFDALLSLPPKPWLIDQVIGRGDIGMIYGPPGCGKTFVVIDLILAACTGEQWAKRFDPVSKLNVAYCAGEGISGLPSRFKAAARRYSVTSLPMFTFFKTIPQFFIGNAEDDITAATIKQFVREWKKRQTEEQTKPLDILVIDTLHTATTAADENSAKDMGQVLHLCRETSLDLGCAIILVHHTNKTGSAERGSSALRGAMDFMVEVRKISETGTKAVMSCAKLKDGEQWKEQTFDLTAMEDSVCVWWDEPGDSESGDKRKTKTGNEILDVLSSGTEGRKLTAKQIGDAMGITQQAVNRVIARLVKDKFVCRHEEQDARGSWLFSITTTGKDALSGASVSDEELSKHGI